MWMMAACREGVDRQFGVVNVQPEYAKGGRTRSRARQEVGPGMPGPYRITRCEAYSVESSSVSLLAQRTTTR